ncbi:DUF992 domain-containing protein [Allorhizobium taibaishanense]|uniref:DUF992 domain-containing protein n=1 Tax=Allorhizobium taibaishanense TaxID=887144 RepID=A0A1Q9A8B4_9HYPH|nr:DUF992 domain-containing protein [Allorhizobium taibaishanense]MBB4009707.1 hypothetical protein [Allorhizobium taibaishanense]OLP50787.1 hypothetical protein BJF91_05915 [Allorhizobium taibaishanense]
MSLLAPSKAARLSAVALAAAIALPLGATGAKAAVQVGMLTCEMSPGISAVVGSSRDLTCEFKPTSSAPVEYYQGKLSKFGVDLGYVQGGKMAWAVYAPGHLVEGALQGSYGGTSANVAVGFGGAVNVLMGGFEGSVALQPIALESTLGINLGATLASLKLSYMPPSTPKSLDNGPPIRHGKHYRG